MVAKLLVILAVQNAIAYFAILQMQTKHFIALVIAKSRTVVPAPDAAAGKKLIALFVDKSCTVFKDAFVVVDIIADSFHGISTTL